MGNSKHWFIYRFLVGADFLALLLAVIIAASIAGKVQTGFDIVHILEMRFSISNIFGFLLLVGCWILIFKYQQLYRPFRKDSRPADNIFVIAKATAIGALFLAALGLIFQVSMITPLFIGIFWPIVTLLECILRKTSLNLLNRLHVGDRNQRNFLIVGTNSAASQYAAVVQDNAHLGYRLLGFIDDAIHKPSTSINLLGSFEDFPVLAKKMVIDEVVIAMPLHSNFTKIRKIVDYAHEMGISVRFPFTQIFNNLATREIWRVRQEVMMDAWGFSYQDLVVYSGHQVGVRYLIKRLFDIAAASASLVLASPVMLLAALAIYLKDGSPVFFLQDRYGYHGRVFKLYKFRTMIKNADAMQDALRAQSERDGAAFKLKSDPRVTAVGQFLRKSSIDELPQLINVLKGDMSLVGPRPLPLADYERITNVSHLRRLSVLPGITGTWQISGRDHISFDEWMQMDMNYIDEWRLSTDIKILLKTVPTVLFGRGSH